MEASIYILDSLTIQRSSTGEYRIAGCTKGVNASYYEPKKTCVFILLRRGEIQLMDGVIYI